MRSCLTMFPMAVMTLIAVLALPVAEAAATGACPIRDLSVSPPSLWLLCAEGRVAVTTDGGATWREHDVPFQEELRGIEALDSQRAYAAGDNGTLLETSDGGRTWNEIPVPAEENLTSVRFFGESGWVTGWGGVMLRSPDGGRTWKRQPTNVAQALEQVYFADANHGWAVGWVGTIIRTIDGGETWREVRTPAALWSLSSVYFRDFRNGWAVGFLGTVLRTRDGGLTWEEQASPVENWLTSIVFSSPERGWIAAEDGVLFTDDGGDSWQYTDFERRLYITKLTSLDGSLVAASSRGLLRITGDGSILEEPRIIFAFGASDSQPGRQT